MRSRLWVITFLLLLWLTPLVVAQSPVPTPGFSSSPSPSPTPTPIPTHTPIVVQIITPETTPTPSSPWPPEVEKVVATLGALWRTFGCWTIAILLLIGLFALARGVGKELLDTWSKQIATWLDDRRKNLAAKLRRGPGPAESALLSDIFDRYEYLEMKGFVREKVMTASLESIYVPLFTYGRGEGGKLPRGGELGGLLARESAGEPTPLSALLPHHRCLVIVGEAGAGKSTFLRHVALTLARALRDRRPALLRQRLDWETASPLLPILLPLSGFGLFLRELSDAQKESPNPDLLLDYMRLHFRDLHLPEDFFESHLKREGDCLVLLDGMDEVAYFEDRVLISQTITLFAQRYDGARFIVTCRPEGYQSGAQLGADFQRADIAPLRWPDDIVTFVARWNETVLKASSHAATDNAQDFLHRLERQERVRALADNPLLLTVMIIVHFNVGRLPERRAELYDNATELLLSWDTRWRRKLTAPPTWLDDIKPAGKRIYLEELAYYWQQQSTLEMRRQDTVQFLTPFFLTGPREDKEKEREAAERAAIFLDWVVERSYLLRPLGNALSFYRRAFQEYLGARRLAREPGLEEMALGALATDWDWWEETVLLAIDHLSASDPPRAAALLQALLSVPDEAALSYRHLVLAGRAMADAAREHLPWQLVAEVTTRLDNAITRATSAFAIPLRIHAGHALGHLGDPRILAGERRTPDGVRFILPPWSQVIPAGPFPMGSRHDDPDAYDDEYSSATGFGPHLVDIAYDYRVGRYPVTNAEYACFIQDKGYHKEQYWETENARAWLRGELDLSAPWLKRWRQIAEWVRTGQLDPDEWLARRRISPGYADQLKWAAAASDAELEAAVRQAYGVGERATQPRFWDDVRYNNPSQPVVGVCWFEAMAYCAWLRERVTQSARQQEVDLLMRGLAECQIRLPSEAEWEKAARWDGAEARCYPWRGAWDETLANTLEGRVLTTTPVGVYPDGASPCGALDMAGNVWEWTRSRWGPEPERPAFGYPYQADDGREEEEASDLRVVRGGSWA